MEQKSPPEKPTRHLVSLSVRELVQFVMLSGDLERGLGVGGSAADAAVEGIRGHQKVQSSRPEGYQAEVPLSIEVEKGELTLKLRGRVDGIWPREEGTLIEEIKTHGGFREIQPRNVHWAQGKVYAHIYLQEHPAERIDVRLTYFNRHTHEVDSFDESFTAEELESYFQELTELYASWLQRHLAWCRQRDASITALSFPYETYREGQRDLAKYVYRAITDKQRFFVEAPTGIGKTIAVLFPAIKAMQQGLLSKLFYLTAKTMGRETAEKAFADMRKAGLHFRVVTLTARDKICFKDPEQQSCDVTQCPYAIGYYDRLKDALQDVFAQEVLDRPNIEAIAQKHTVCPFELSLDASVWADALICDYNYVFDPKVHLRRYFADEKGDYAIFVDEAHNLVDRARSMFSAGLDKQDVLGLKRTLQTPFPKCAKTLHHINKHFVALRKEAEAQNPSSRRLTLVQSTPDEELLKHLHAFIQHAEAALLEDPSAEPPEGLLDFYFRARDFLHVRELYDEEDYATIFEKDRRHTLLQLNCIDPSRLLKLAMKRAKSFIFFSATLRPIDYYRDLLGGEEDDPYLQLPSPFPPEHLSLWIEDRIGTDYRSRPYTYGHVATAIQTVVQQKPGNYLVFFPSYRYLEEVYERFVTLCPHLPTRVQTRAMREDEREAFLAAFQTPSSDGDEAGEHLIGFVVMGGIFGEAIDLVGERLIGAAIVGVGLPQVCLERDLIRKHFEKKKGAGFDYAYVYPGMNKVLQAVGRVIRSETDQGTVLLIDRRFARPQYYHLFPSWWNPRPLHQLHPRTPTTPTHEQTNPPDKRENPDNRM